PSQPPWVGRRTQRTQRPQQRWSPLNTPELEPEREVDVARRPEFTNHPVVVDAVRARNAAIVRHAQDRLGHTLQIPPADEVGLELIENLTEPRDVRDLLSHHVEVVQLPSG